MNRFDRVFQTDGQTKSLDKAPKPALIEVAPEPAKITDYEKDPRSDIDADHVLWVALLTTAKTEAKMENGTGNGAGETAESNPALFEILHALRCGGASLEKDKDFGMLVRPGQWDKVEYEDYRAKHLVSRKAEVMEILKAAARKLPEAQRHTLKARMTAVIKAVESRASALGWTERDLRSEQEWDDPDGRRRESLFMALVTASQGWGHAELGEITEEYAEIIIPRAGLRGETDTLRTYRVTPGARPLLGDAEAHQETHQNTQDAHRNAHQDTQDAHRGTHQTREAVSA